LANALESFNALQNFFNRRRSATNQFFLTVSHEIKTTRYECAAGHPMLPFQGINAAIQVLLADATNALSQSRVKVFQDIFFTDIFNHAQLGK